MKNRDEKNMYKKIKSKYANWIYSHTSFPNGCKSGNELDWMLKENCPKCLSHPIESLSNAEYHNKYPARNRLVLGSVTIYLCDVHLKELYEDIQKYYKEKTN